jgi:hypothetical protein
MRRFLFLLMLTAVAAGQVTALPLPPREAVVRGAEGRCAIVNVTPEQARAGALVEAKTEALRKAGIGESIKASEALFTTGAAGQLFGSFSLSEMQGSITQYTVTKDTVVRNDTDNLFYAVVVIDAKVKPYSTKPDPAFTFAIDGLRPSYRDGEKITFRFCPNKEGYLKVFLFDEAGNASAVFPNAYEPDRRFAAKDTVAFPISPVIDYTAEAGKNGETNALLFVYTKQDIAFGGRKDYSGILDRINGIEPDGRSLRMETMMVFKH